MDLVQPVRVEALDGWRIRVAFADTVSCEVDLSDMAEEPICAAWRDSSFWRGVHIADHRTAACSDEIEFCPDSLYADLTGQSLGDVYLCSESQWAHV